MRGGSSCRSPSRILRKCLVERNLHTSAIASLTVLGVGRAHLRGWLHRRFRAAPTCVRVQCAATPKVSTAWVPGGRTGMGISCGERTTQHSGRWGLDLLCQSSRLAWRTAIRDPDARVVASAAVAESGHARRVDTLRLHQAGRSTADALRSKAAREWRAITQRRVRDHRLT